MLTFLVQLSFFCLGLAGIIGSVVSFVLAGQRKLERGIEEYARAVQAWPAASAQLQSASSVALHADADVAGASPSKIELKGLSESDPFRGTKEGEILQGSAYQAFLFRAGLAPELPLAWTTLKPLEPSATPRPSTLDAPGPEGFLPEANFSRMEALSDMARWGANTTLTLMIGGSRIEFEVAPLVRSVAHFEPGGVYDRCLDLGGWETSGQKCWVYERLKALCVQVAVDASGGWRLAPRVPGLNGSYGCSYQGGSWQALTYEKVAVGPPHLDRPTNETVAFDDFSVEVRSAADPLFTALEWTYGTMSFGWSQADEDILGIVLMVLGCVFIVQPCVQFGWRFRKRQEHMRKAPDLYGFRGGGRFSASGGAGGGSPARWRGGAPDPERVGMRDAADPDPEGVAS